MAVLELARCGLVELFRPFRIKESGRGYVAASPSFCDFAGKQEDDLRGCGDFEFFPSVIAEVLHRHDTAVLRTLQPYAWEEGVDHPKGKLWLHLHKTPVFDPQQVCIGLLCSVRDISEERRAAEQVKIFARAGQDGFWLLDLHGNILDINHSYCAVSGHRRGHLVGKNIHDIEVLTTPEDLSLRHRRIMEVGWEHFRALHRGDDGRIIEFEVCGNYIDISGGRFYQFFREITSALNEVPVKEEADAVESEKGPAAHLWKQVNLNDIVQQGLTLQFESWPQGIKVEQNLHPALWQTLANHAQLLQTFMNFLTNAVEAVGARGRIDISTRNVEMTAELATSFPQLEPGRYVYLAIEDNGKGISEKLVEKVFEPFITTKFKGRGMGLPSAFRNVTDHSGYIGVKSKEGQGSTFSVYLQASDVSAKMSTNVGNVPTGIETILLIDSSGEVLKETQEMLERLAYKVLIAHDMDTAIEIGRSYPGRIHLAIMDGAFVESYGRDALGLLKKTRRKMDVVLSGDGMLREALDDWLEQVALSYVEKPFRVESLVTLIRSALDS